MWYHDGDGIMNGEKTTKEISNSYQRQCSICRQIFSEKKLIFSFVVDDWICLDCYKKHFTRTPVNPRPVSIASFSG